MQPKPDPASITVKHSNTSGQKSVTIDAHTTLSHWEWETTTASSSTTVTTGEFTAYTLSINEGVGSLISVNRMSSVVGGSTGNLSNGAGIYQNDVLQVAFDAEPGYELKTHTLNGSTFVSGNTHTVGGNVIVAATAELQGLFYIHNGTSWDMYQVFVDNGTSWDQYIPYIDNGTNWDMYS
jgi:hypothetical protein